MAEVGSAYVTILPSAKGFSNRLSRELDAPSAKAGREAGRRAGEAMNAGIGAPLKKLAGVVGGAFALAKVKDLLGSAISDASDLNESASKSAVVFGKANVAVEKFAQTSARTMGQSRQQALEATSTFGNLFVALGFGQRPAAKLSTSLVRLGSDLASFNNVSPDEALLALRSGLLGEAEPLRKFGVSLSQTRIEAEAVADSIVKPVKSSQKIKSALLRLEVAQTAVAKATKLHGSNSLEARKAADQLAQAQATLNVATKGSIPELNAAQKAQAAYNIILKDTKTAQGDFGRTSNGLANQQRILSAEFKDASAQLGTALLPAANKIVHVMTNALQPGSKFRDVMADVGDAAKGTWAKAKPIFTFIGDHPKLFSQVAIDAGLLAVAFKTIGTLKKFPALPSLFGGGKGILGGITKAAPLPVLVVNEGFGLPGTPGGPKGGPKGPSTTGKVLNRSRQVGQTLTLAGGFLTAGEIGNQIGTAAGNAINKHGDRNLSDTQKQTRDLVLQLIKTIPKTDANGKPSQSGKDAIAAAQKVFAGGGHTVDLAAAMDFLNKYGAKTAEVQAAVRRLAKDPQVVAALRARAAQVNRNVQLISGGFLTLADLTNTSTTKAGTAVSSNIGKGVRFAMDRADQLRGNLGDLGKVNPKPRVNTADLVKSSKDAVSLLEALQKIDGTYTAKVKVIIPKLPANRALALDPDFRAAGGPVSKRKPYIVGEHGPELFVPDVAGQIIANGKMAMSAAGKMAVRGPQTTHTGPSYGDVTVYATDWRNARQQLERDTRIAALKGNP